MLGEIKSEKAANVLIKASKENKKPYVRAYAVYALGEIKSEKAIDAIIKVLIEDKNKDVRCEAVQCLGGIKRLIKLSNILNESCMQLIVKW